MKFRKKPVVIEAVQFVLSDERITELNESITQGDTFEGFQIYRPAHGKEKSDYYLTIPTLEGDHRANYGDWIITGIKGEKYPCKPNIFEQTYEPVDTESDNTEVSDD